MKAYTVTTRSVRLAPGDYVLVAECSGLVAFGTSASVARAMLEDGFRVRPFPMPVVRVSKERNVIVWKPDEKGRSLRVVALQAKAER